MFTVHAFLVQQEASRSEPIHDEGENKLHNTQIQNIQPSTTYTIYVVAKNKHGNSSSEKMKCNTVEGLSFEKKSLRYLYYSLTDTVYVNKKYHSTVVYYSLI